MSSGSSVHFGEGSCKVSVYSPTHSLPYYRLCYRVGVMRCQRTRKTYDEVCGRGSYFSSFGFFLSPFLWSIPRPWQFVQGSFSFPEIKVVLHSCISLIGSFLVPFKRFLQILFHTHSLAILIHRPRLFCAYENP